MGQVLREVLEVPVDRVVLAGRVVQGNRMSMVDLVALVDQVVMADQVPIKQGSLVVLPRGASRRNARRTANSSRKVIRPVRERPAIELLLVSNAP